jgi:tetratricopeptide (TPR) repeat protein
VLAGFAFGRRDYHEAAKHQFEWAKSAEEAGEHAEAASAWYNLGNTMLASGANEHAERFFVQSCELCLEHGMSGILPMALTNLGVALSRQNRPDEAVSTLLVAYKNFKALGHRPGQAFVFDALASVYFEQQRHDEAERAWLAAYDIYDGITSDAFADLRASGCEDIRAKLERFDAATKRSSQLGGRSQLAGTR